MVWWRFAICGRLLPPQCGPSLTCIREHHSASLPKKAGRISASLNHSKNACRLLANDAHGQSPLRCALHCLGTARRRQPFRRNFYEATAGSPTQSGLAPGGFALVLLALLKASPPWQRILVVRRAFRIMDQSRDDLLESRMSAKMRGVSLVVHAVLQRIFLTCH